MALFIAAGVTVVGALAAGGYGLYRFFSQSRSDSTVTGQGGYHDEDEERRGLIVSASSTSSESEADFEASSEEQPDKEEETNEGG